MDEISRYSGNLYSGAARAARRRRSQASALSEPKGGAKTDEGLLKGVFRILCAAAAGAAGIRKNRLLLATLLASASVFLIAGMSFRVGLEVSLDGVPAGCVASQEAFEEIVDKVEARVSEIVGYDYALVPDVGYSFTIRGRDRLLDSDAIERALFSRVAEVKRMYVLTVDGKTVGGYSSAAPLRELLETLKAKYTDENTVSAEFAQDVSVTYGYASAALCQDLDELSERLNARIGDRGGYSYLTVKTVERLAYTETLPYETVRYDSAEFYTGVTKVTTAGAKGLSTVTAEATCLNGEEVSREVVSAETAVQPINELVAVGTTVRPKTASYGCYIWPAAGQMTSGFGLRHSGMHKGIDIVNSSGTPICAADGGTVIYAGWMSGFGNLIQVQHDNGEVTYYAHLCSFGAGVGDKVYQGQSIGQMGCTGNAECNHLHFEIRVGGTPVDPMNYLS